MGRKAGGQSGVMPRKFSMKDFGLYPQGCGSYWRVLSSEMTYSHLHLHSGCYEANGFWIMSYLLSGKGRVPYSCSSLDFKHLNWLLGIFSKGVCKLLITKSFGHITELEWTVNCNNNVSISNQLNGVFSSFISLLFLFWINEVNNKWTKSGFGAKRTFPAKLYCETEWEETQLSVSCE